jgi:hypothetical protein
MGKSTINVVFSIAMLNYQRVFLIILGKDSRSFFICNRCNMKNDLKCVYKNVSQQKWETMPKKGWGDKWIQMKRTEWVDLREEHLHKDGYF